MKDENQPEEGRKKRCVDSAQAISIPGLSVEPVRAEINSLCAQRGKWGRAESELQLGKGTGEGEKKQDIPVDHLLHWQPA